MRFGKQYAQCSKHKIGPYKYQQVETFKYLGVYISNTITRSRKKWSELVKQKKEHGHLMISQLVGIKDF